MYRLHCILRAEKEMVRFSVKVCGCKYTCFEKTGGGVVV